MEPKVEEGEINLVWPRGGIKDFVKAGYTSKLLTLRKRDPSLPSAGEPESQKLDIKVNWKPYDKQDFQMSMYET